MAILAAFFLTVVTQDKVLDLVERLGSENIEERERATGALKALGKDALPVLRKASRERVGEIAARASDLVRWIEVQLLLTPTIKDLFPDLEKELLERKPKLWWSVFKSLKYDNDPELDRLNPTERGLVYEKALQEAEGDESRKEVLEEAALRPGPMDTTEIISILTAKDPRMRSVAAMALGRLGATVAVRPLREALEAAEWEVRFRAAEALGRLKAREAVNDLRRMLLHPPDVVGAAAATALGQIGMREAEPALRALLKEPCVLRSAAAHALAELGVEDGPLLLAKVLEEEEFHFKLEAAERLAAGGPKGFSALRDCLKHKDPIARGLAIDALAKARHREAIPELAALLSDPDPKVRESAISALSDLDSRIHAPSLVKLLSDSEWAVRRAAADALGRLGAKDAIPELRKALKDSAPYAQFAAAASLCILGDDAGVPLLLSASKLRYKVVSEAVPLTALNALRNPVAWSRLAMKPLEASVEGRTPQVLKKLAETGNLKLELGDPDSKLDEANDPWLQRRLAIPAGRGSLLDAVRSVRGSGACDFILGENTLRVVSHSEAMKFWSDWWAGREKEK